jgi:hypothetical protein
MGYLGEKKIIHKNIACLLGFIALFAMTLIIYKQFIENKYHFINSIMFYVFVVVWFGYGVAYLFNKENKNIANNILDLISKAFVGIGMWIYYIKVIRLK